jgi:hypothetical protein
VVFAKDAQVTPGDYVWVEIEACSSATLKGRMLGWVENEADVQRLPAGAAY